MKQVIGVAVEPSRAGFTEPMPAALARLPRLPAGAFFGVQRGPAPEFAQDATKFVRVAFERHEVG